MSFLIITDPSKRATIVDEYIKLKKSIRQNSLSEKLGDSDLQRDLIKLYKPITESQAGIAKELSDTSTALKALPATISSSLQAIMPPTDPFSQYPSIEALETKSQAFEEPTQRYGVNAAKYLRLYATNKKIVDTTFGIYSKDDMLYIGNSPITIQDDDVTVGDKTYTGTPGVWELITRANPDKSIYNADDYENYADILQETQAMQQSTNSNKPKASKSIKYREIIKPIWENRTKGKAGTTRKLVAPPIILFSDPDELINMLELRMDAYNAGNTGVVNEIVAICDELLQQGVIDKKTYKEYVTKLNRTCIVCYFNS